MSGSRAERQKKIDYLNGYYWTLQSIKLTKEKIAQRSNRLYGVRSPIISDMPRGGKGKDLVDKIDEKDEAIAELQRRLDRSEKKKLEIETVIRAVGNERYIMLLELAYIDNLSLDQVAEAMSLSYSRITKLHGLALDMVELPKAKKRKDEKKEENESNQ